MSSDSASSEVTHTSISSHGDPLAWDVYFFRLQELDSPEAAPASLDYVLGPEEPEHAPLSPDYAPDHKYPEYMAPADDEIIAEDQPYADSASRDFYKKFYNSLGRVPNRCSSSIGKARGVVIVHSRNRLGRLDRGLTEF
ncbi:hypothetical protein Tco_0318402 [Tanacetum coccineum]